MIILLVDDEKDIRNSLADFLTRLGHQVLEASNGKEALDILQKEKVHMGLSDIRMPVMDGHELLSRIKSSPEIKDVVVILFTGFGEIKEAVEAMRNGAYDYLIKPINVKELAITIDRISEYLALKQEHRQLTRNFQSRLNEATRDIQKELNEVKKAYAREVGLSEIGIFSDKLRQVFRTAKRLHRNRDIPVLIEGETGTGKELIARYIHYGDGEITTPFVAINCAAISSGLFESELFGYEAGAFTGARPKGQKGKIELAEAGTIFLDEIAEMAPDHQAKILRVIQEREYYRVGGLKKQIADVRIICATNRDLRQVVSEGSFRQDLFYRLNVGHIRVPSLRERKEEILPLARMILIELYEQKKTRFRSINPKAAKTLEEYDWPGNIRELQSVIGRITLLWDETEIKPQHLDFLNQDRGFFLKPAGERGPVSIEDITLPEEGLDLEKWTLEIVKKSLDKHFWNKTETAKYLGLTRGVLYTYLRYLEKK
jgi:DNA-binding NtrC family response regulator